MSVKQVHDTTIPAGYKQTEVGVIPEDWDALNLKDAITLQRGFDLPHRMRINGDIPIVTSSGIDDFHNEMKVKAPGVVTGRYGTIGEVFYVENDFWPLNTTLFVKEFKNNNPLFISYLLKTIDFKTHSGKSGVPGVNRNDLHKLRIPLPPLPEQRAIAEALSDADTLIDALGRLIAKKRRIKEGAMQELLTGKRRLPGFAGKWERKRLGDVAEIDPENLSASTDPNFSFNYISLEGVDKGFLGDYSELLFQSAPSRARRVLKKTDVLISTVRPNLLSHYYFRGMPGRWVCSTGFSVARCIGKPLVPEYLFAQLFAGDINRQIDSLIAGSNYPAINSNDVRNLFINMPSCDEQSAIAAVLSDMDAEIEALEAKLAKARLVKRGMMQELLSGKIRLV